MLKDDITALSIQHNFAMPGHKGRLCAHDITEIDGADDLRAPVGILKNVQERLRKAFGASECYMSVQGSTLGNFAFIYSARVISDNKKVYVSPDPHVSIPNACKVLGLELVETADFAKLDDALCVIITYPTYFGECIETHSIVERAHERGLPVFFDNAHGAHLYFNKTLPPDPMTLGADCAVCSTHKTLPCLGQTAVICRNFDSLIPAEILQNAINTFQTTSPSYLLMSSIDEGVAYMAEHGETEISSLIEKAMELTEIVPDDKTKIIVSIDKKQALIDNNITWERIEDGRILLLPSVWNTDEDFDALRRAIK